jgi:hypothetical protein
VTVHYAVATPARSASSLVRKSYYLLRFNFGERTTTLKASGIVHARFGEGSVDETGLFEIARPHLHTTTNGEILFAWKQRLQTLGETVSAWRFKATGFDRGHPALHGGGLYYPAAMTWRWDGEQFSQLTSWMNNHVDALAQFQGHVIAGGKFTLAGGIAAPRVARWSGSAWSPLGAGLNDGVNALAVYDGGSGPALFAGGRFTASGTVSLAHIARWDGQSWSPLSVGTDGEVKALVDLFTPKYASHHQAAAANFLAGLPSSASYVQKRADLVAFLLSIDDTTVPFAIPAGADICASY